MAAPVAAASPTTPKTPLPSGPPANPIDAKAPGPEIPSPEWLKIAEINTSEGWLGFMTVADGKWFAPGKDVLLEGTETGGTDVVRRDLPGVGLQRVGSLRGIGLVAVGSPQVIFEFDGGKWREVHRGGPKEMVGRFADVLAYVDEVPDGGKEHLLASGPVALLQRRADGRWQSVASTKRAALKNVARGGPPGLSCPSILWRWRPAGKGWYVCTDGRTFLYDGVTSFPAPNLPAACPANIAGTNITDAGVGLICDERVFVWRTGSPSWTTLSPPEPVRSVAVGKTCVFANSQAAVWKRCGE